MQVLLHYSLVGRDLHDDGLSPNPRFTAQYADSRFGTGHRNDCSLRFRRKFVWNWALPRKQRTVEKLAARTPHFQPRAVAVGFHILVLRTDSAVGQRIQHLSRPLKVRTQP